MTEKMIAKRCSFDENNNFYATDEVHAIHVTQTIIETTNSDYPVGSVS